MEKIIDIVRLRERIMSKECKAVAIISSEIRYCIGKFLREKGFIEINPVIVSPITDPLRHQVLDGSIEYLGAKYHLTKSMIFHKQLALLCQNKIFIFSPNVRLEPPEYSSTGRHLIEFTQVDLEVKNAPREYVMELAEEMLEILISYVKIECAEELRNLKRNIEIPTRPFKRYKYYDVFNTLGPDFEKHLSVNSKAPFWIVDFPINMREFYDREYDEYPGVLCDMDLVYPEGYGEALSGGEREFKYEKILRRMALSNIDPSSYRWYLDFAQKGLYPSVGFGIGLERLTRYICGLNDISLSTLFPKKPGKWSI